MTNNTSVRQRLESIARQWIEEGWQKGNAMGVRLMYALDFVDVSSPTGHLGTRDDNINGIVELYEAFPDFYATIDDLVLDADTGRIAVRWTGIGTHRKAFLGVEATGKQITFHGIEILHIKDDLITERAGEWDGIEILHQLGALS